MVALATHVTPLVCNSTEHLECIPSVPASRAHQVDISGFACRREDPILCLQEIENSGFVIVAQLSVEDYNLSHRPIRLLGRIGIWKNIHVGFVANVGEPKNKKKWDALMPSLLSPAALPPPQYRSKFCEMPR